MLSAFQAAVTAGSRASRPPWSRPPRSPRRSTARWRAGIPVITYNANGASHEPHQRPGLRRPGAATCRARRSATRLASLMKPKGERVGFIAQPGALNIQPRLDGATQALEAAGHEGRVRHTGVDTGASATQEAQGCPVPPVARVQHPGRLRGRRRRHRPARHLAAEVRPGRQGAGRRLRPGAADPDARSRPARSTSPSTSRRTCRASCRRCTCTSSSSPAAWWRRRPRTPA